MITQTHYHVDPVAAYLLPTIVNGDPLPEGVDPSELDDYYKRPYDNLNNPDPLGPGEPDALGLVPCLFTSSDVLTLADARDECRRIADGLPDAFLAYALLRLFRDADFIVRYYDEVHFNTRFGLVFMWLDPYAFYELSPEHLDGVSEVVLDMGGVTLLVRNLLNALLSRALALFTDDEPRAVKSVQSLLDALSEADFMAANWDYYTTPALAGTYWHDRYAELMPEDVR